MFNEFLSFKTLKLAVLALAGLGLLSLSGCGLFSDMFEDEGEEIESPPQVMAYEGMEQLQAENYRTAAETFERLKDQYPYSKFAILAELKMADALYLKSEYVNALSAYEDFERLHPNNEAVPYVIYMQGMCEFKQMNGHQRDQMPTVKAIQNFYRLQQMYPGTKYAAAAEARLAEAKSNLAGHEFYVGEFYFRMEAYKAALGRFISLIQSYPDSGYHTRALEYIRVCRDKMAELGIEEEAPVEAAAGAPMYAPSDEAIREALEPPQIPEPQEFPTDER
ncbi:MAG: outer membrane protein assembly factor BamD [Thermodesulfobacteriota bacterium]